MRRFAPVPRRASFVRLFSGIIFAVSIALTTISAQIPGRNINMVAGNEWPNGDPYLQRQNEPSIGASTRNPLHLLAGANDYRTVDLPGLAEDETGDAWLGLFKSNDGGQRWTSTLLPGYPQDHSAAGLSSPIHGYGAGADSVVRAGTNGLMYFSGLAFDRSNAATPDVPGKSAIFVARFIDNNNKEAGDPFEYLGTRALQTDAGGATGNFLDKPWLAVDIPRDTSRCTIVTPGEKGPITQSIPSGPVYVAYTLRSTDTKGERYDIMFTRSADCGNTWSVPTRLNDPAERANQGAAMAIDPRNGNVFITWRQFDLSDNDSGTDALMVAKYNLPTKKLDAPKHARKFDKPKKKDKKKKGIDLKKFYKKGGVNQALEAAELSPLDQATSATQIRFRTNAYPTMVVDETGRIYLAWAERGYDPLSPDPVLGSARVLIATSTDGSTWTTAKPVNVNEPGQKGHQLMPSINYAGGKLMLIYYDVRQSRAQAFTQYIDDKTAFQPGVGTGLRHTIDLRASMASPGANPAFAPSVPVSEYLEGPRIPGGPSTPWQVNPPNLPMFQKGTAPFIGDYVDIAAAPNFIVNASGKWVYNNVAGSTPPTFHAAWTDNRDVRVPLHDISGPNGVPDGNPWNDYTPPTGPGGFASIFDPSKIVPMCIPGNAGSRNQNIYTARITGGLLVGSPGNTKRLGYRVDEDGAQLTTLMQRSFVVFAQNTVIAPPDHPELATRRFRFTINNQPPGGRASFDQFSAAPLTTIDADIPYRSTASRTVYATSTDPHAIINVSVAELVASGNTWVVKTGGLGSVIVLNPDIDNPDIDNPDIDNPDIDNPDIDNVEVFNPDIDNPDIDNPDIDNPDIDNPDIDNPDIDNVRVANPDIDNPDIDNPDIDNPDIDNPDIDNPDIDNPDIDNGSLMSDVSWSITNNGNTTASYNVNLFFAQQTFDARISTQLILYRTYKTPVVQNCDLKSETRNVLVANVPNPQLVKGSTGTVSNPNDSAATNATIYLAPGESAKITLRVFDPAPPPGSVVTVTNADGSTALISSQFVPNEDVTPVVQQQSVNTEDVDKGVTEPPPVVQFTPPQAAADEVYTTPNTPVTLNVLANDSAAFGSTKILSSHPAGLGQNLGGGANELIYMPTTNFVYVGSGRAVGVVDPVANKLVGRIPYDPSEGPITWGIAAPRAGLVLFRTFTQGAPNASILALDTRPTVNGLPNPTFHKFLSPGANQAAVDALGNASTIGLDRNGLTAYFAAGFVDTASGGANSQMTISAVNIDHGPGADFAHIYWTYPLPQGAAIRHVVQNPVTGKLYMSTTGANGGIYVMDPAAPAVPTRISGADGATTIAVNPAANLIVTAGITSLYQFNIIDGDTHAVVKRALPASAPGVNRSPRFSSFEDRLAIHYATGKVFLRTQSEVFILDAQPGSASFGQLSAGGPINVSTEFDSSDLVIDQQRGIVATTGNFRLSTFFIDAYTNAAYEKFQSRAGGELAVDELHGKIFAADFLNSIYTYTVPSAAGATAVTLSVFPETTNAVVNPFRNEAYIGINDATASEVRFNGAGRIAGALGINTQGRWGFGGWHDGSKRAAVINSGSDATGQISRPGSIAFINGTNDQILAEVNTVGQPFGLGVNQSTGQVYVAGLSGADASGVSLHGKIAIHDIANPFAPFVDVTIDPAITALPNQLMSFARQVVVHPSTNKAYVALTTGSQTSVVYIPPSTIGAPVTALPIDVTASLPDVIAGGDLIAPKTDYRVDVIRVAPAPINRVYLGMVNNTAIAQGVLNAYQVVALDATTHQVMATYAGGSHSRLHSASWLAIDATRNHLFVVDYEADKVTMLNATNLSFISDATLPDGPSATAINLASGHLYVSSVKAKAITALSTTDLKLLSSVKLPLQAFFIYPDEIESRIYTTGGNSPDESGVMIVTDVLGKLGTDVSVDDTPANGLKGTTVRNDDYSITYTPALTAVPGDDHFTYAVRTAGGSATGDVNVHLVPAVESAVANGDAYATPQRWSTADAGLSVAAPGVLVNDLSFGGIAQLVSGPQQPATFALNSDGSFTYTPGVGTTGLDRFTYRIAGTSASNTVTVWLVTTASPSPTVVTNTSDSGAGSLRNAITYSNAQPGTQTISFAIPNVTINAPALINVPTTALPALTDPVVIDGSTQSAWDGRPVVEVRGPSNTSFAGFVLSANSITIRGLSITRFLRGVDASPGTSGHLIDSNHFGINRSNFINGNAVGIYWQAASSSIVNNVVSKNTQNGMELRPGADNNFILGNKVGMGSNGAPGFGNSGVGIALTSVSNNTIGGSAASDRNIIVSNSLAGVRIQPVGGGTANGNSIVGNWIGLVDGTNTSGNNSLNGAIFLDTSAGATISNTIIGGAAAARNVIAGNGGNGIGLYGAGTMSTSIRGNYIGVIGDGSGGFLARPNAAAGVWISGASDNTVGGLNQGDGNTIAFNNQVGVGLNGNGVRNRILGNSIYSNAGQGIDIDGNNLVLANDPLDADTGTNNRQNYPVITALNAAPSATEAQGTLDSTPNTTFTLQLFRNTTCDASNYGEGADLRDTQTITTAFNGQGFFSLTSAGAPGGYFTVTATDPNGNTSEFSACNPSVGPPAPVISSVTPSNFGPGQMVTIDGTNLAPISPNDFSFMQGTNNLPATYMWSASPTRVVLRTNGSLVAGPVQVIMNAVGGAPASAAFNANVGAGPAPPILHNIFAGSCATSYTPVDINSAAQGSSITAVGTGVDTTGATFVFTPATGGSTFVASTVACGGPGGRVAISAVIPSNLPPGNYSVALRQSIAASTSGSGNALALNVTPTTANITSVSPNPSAPGFGQLLWINGTNLPGVTAADVIFNFGGNDTPAQHLWYVSPTLVIARFNLSTPIGNATVRVKSPDGSSVSNAFTIAVQSTPGAPILTSLSTNCTAGFINSASAGSSIWVGAKGIDSQGATVVFTPTSPPGAPVEVAASNTCGNTSAFSASLATVPGFAPGTVVNVQLKTTVNANTSPLSNGTPITVTAPPVNVNGLVRYSSTPLIGTTVKLVQGASNNPPLQTTTTNGFGFYQFNNVAAGNYLVRVDAPDPTYLAFIAAPITVGSSNVTRDVYMPKQITLQTPADNSTDVTAKPDLTWTANPEATRYIVRIMRASDNSLIEVNQAFTNSYTVQTLLTGSEQYAWEVQAMDTYNNEVGATLVPYKFTVIAPLVVNVAGTSGGLNNPNYMATGTAATLGAILANGQKVWITAVGGVSFCLTCGAQDPNGFVPNTADTQSLAPGLIISSLVASINGSPWTTVGTGPTMITAVGSGVQLLLAVNDNNYNDNSGSWTVTIQR